ncbi:hypothetical protein [Piscinibacter defluvii]|uniref:hypothetical protein n=1 Tax=Piscinibacter defluvii TaxID=1796922 RepID=UPI000FDF1529|nr:hypothetical protein [Piscinibacter defluvii]
MPSTIDEPATVSVDELRAQYRREIEAHRAAAHREIDRYCDSLLEQQRLELERLKLMLDGGAVH